MVIINPITFAQVKIDETQITEEEAELLKRISTLTRRINRMQYEQYILFGKLYDKSGLMIKDLISKYQAS